MKKFGLVLAAGLLVAGCGVGTVPAKDSGGFGVLAPTTSSTYSTPTYSDPVTSETPTASTTPTSVAAPATDPVVQNVAPAAPKTAAPKPKAAPKTTAVAAPKPAPKPAECGADYYRNSDGNCVHRPSADPAGATAKCKDGTYSYSQHRQGTCSGHGGVLVWL